MGRQNQWRERWADGKVYLITDIGVDDLDRAAQNRKDQKEGTYDAYWIAMEAARDRIRLPKGEMPESVPLGELVKVGKQRR